MSTLDLPLILVVAMVSGAEMKSTRVVFAGQDVAFAHTSTPVAQDADPSAGAESERTAECGSDSIRAPRENRGISEREFNRLWREIKRKCGLSLGEQGPLPWYFHYTLGVELLNREDPPRALDSLFTALEKRPEPKRNARLYGMWFEDYVPFFYIGRAHFLLEKYDCALMAFEASETAGELVLGDEEYAERAHMRQLSVERALVRRLPGCGG